MTSEEKAYQSIRSLIVSGVYGGGQHLRAEDLASRIGVSRTPVREALRRLAAEGLVDVFAHRGAFVTSREMRDVEEIYNLRVLLESHAAECAATRLTADQIGTLADLTDHMESHARETSRDLDALTQANDGFHALILKASDNRRLETIVSSIVKLSWVTKTFSNYSAEDLAASISHHREMIKAFSGKDSLWASAVMKAHIKAAHHVFAHTLGAQSGRAADRPRRP